MSSDYRNMRGFNYVATYRSLNVPLASYNGLAWKGVASSSAMWEYYDMTPGGTSALVDEQLSRLKAIGVNTIRVFMSFPVWRHYQTLPGPNQFIERFRHFLDLCKSNGLYCVPVIWDNTGAGMGNPPDYQNYYSAANFHSWHANPGLVEIGAIVGAPSIGDTDAYEYLKMLSQAVEGKPAFLLWDISNELAGVSYPDMETFVGRTLDVLEDLNPSQETMLGLLFTQASHPAYPELNRLASDPRVDVHAVHNYAASRDALRSVVWDATHILVDPMNPSMGVHPPKHVIATENGSPGNGYSYGDGLRHAQNVRRDELGPNQFGLGTLAFSSNVGWELGEYPFKRGAGLFYPDAIPTVRDLNVVAAFVAAATTPTFTPPGIPNLVQKMPGQPGYVPQGGEYVNLEWDEHSEQASLLWTDQDQFGGTGGIIATIGEWFEAVKALDALAKAIQTAGTFANASNGNPYGAGTPNPAGSVVPDSAVAAIAEWRTAITIAPSGGYPPVVSTPLTTAIEEISGISPFDPVNEQSHLDLLAQLTLPYYCDLIRPYVLLQDDNSDL